MNQNTKAATLIVASMTMISSNDAILKLSTGDLGIGQILFIRGAFAALIFSLILWLSGHPVFSMDVLNRRGVARAVCECMATFCFVTSLALLPLPTASTLVWTAPVFLVLASALVFGEDVRPSSWLAVLAGFAGVLLVTQPGAESFSWAMLLPLTAAGLVVVRDMITRTLDQRIPTRYVVLATLVLVAIAGGVTSVLDWRPVSTGNIAWLALSGLLLGLGFYGNILAIRIGEISFISPFLYTGILVAVFWGYIIWDDAIDSLMAAGIIMIIASGLVILGRNGNPATKAP